MKRYDIFWPCFSPAALRIILQTIFLGLSSSHFEQFFYFINIRDIPLSLRIRTYVLFIIQNRMVSVNSQIFFTALFSPAQGAMLSSQFPLHSLSISHWFPPPDGRELEWKWDCAPLRRPLPVRPSFSFPAA